MSGVKCEVCCGVGTTDNHVTGEIECSACEGTGWEELPVVDTGDELLPCPFCGGKAAIQLGAIREVHTVDVVCQDCSGAILAFCEDDAIANWNTRTPTSED